jgi:alkylation response protein AidB-like acyl-CoA dehydrogenase
MDERLAADVVLRGAPAEPLDGGLPALEETLDFGAALVCAEAVGTMKFACDTTLEYLKTRKQFGVPIGTFQALQHRVVDMFISVEQARSMACLAASKADAGGDPRSISAAKIKIADAARHVSQEAVQLHGGMGMSEELKVSHAFRRLTVQAREFGDADHHLARFAAL